jgi:hypothetical protein
MKGLQHRQGKPTTRERRNNPSPAKIVFVDDITEKEEATKQNSLFNIPIGENAIEKNFDGPQEMIQVLKTRKTVARQLREPVDKSNVREQQEDTQWAELGIKGHSR